MYFTACQVEESHILIELAMIICHIQIELYHKPLHKIDLIAYVNACSQTHAGFKIYTTSYVAITLYIVCIYILEFLCL